MEEAYARDCKYVLFITLPNIGVAFNWKQRGRGRDSERESENFENSLSKSEEIRH